MKDAIVNICKTILILGVLYFVFAMCRGCAHFSNSSDKQTYEHDERMQRDKFLQENHCVIMGNEVKRYYCPEAGSDE